jgi:hypothetical protein
MLYIREIRKGRFMERWQPHISETYKDELRRQLRIGAGILAMMALANMLSWKLPGWDEARKKEFKKLEDRDELDPGDFDDDASYRRAWNAADAKAQEAWRDRLALEDDQAT